MWKVLKCGKIYLRHTLLSTDYFRKILMQSDFTKVNEKNLVPSLDCRLPVKFQALYIGENNFESLQRLTFYCSRFKELLDEMRLKSTAFC